MAKDWQENESNFNTEGGEFDQSAASDQITEAAPSIESLQMELADAQAKAAEYLDGWQRARADFANYRKRIERDQAALQQNATGSVVKRFIEIVDDLDRALKNKPQEGDAAVWAGGIDLIYRKLLATLESNGVTLMNASGMFDPNLHEAITSEDSDSHEPGEIIEVIQQGYLLGDRVLRPALVRVAR
jgi:molecular chaperone GrpE